MPPTKRPVMLALLLAVAGPAAAQDSRTSQVDLVQIQLIVPKKVTIGKAFIVLDEVENQGTSTAFQTVTGFYLSLDDVLDDSDVAVGARRVPQLGAGQSHDNRASITLNAETRPGDCYLLAVADGRREIEERTRGNNIRAVRITVLPAKRSQAASAADGSARHAADSEAVSMDGSARGRRLRAADLVDPLRGMEELPPVR